MVDVEITATEAGKLHLYLSFISVCAVSPKETNLHDHLIFTSYGWDWNAFASNSLSHA
jgi:hypothetical protein